MKKVLIHSADRLIPVNQRDILYAFIDAGVVRVVTTSLDGEVRHRTLSEFHEALDGEMFWRCERGYVVNINHIIEIIRWFHGTYQLLVGDKAKVEIPVSRSKQSEMYSRFVIFHQKYSKQEAEITA